MSVNMFLDGGIEQEEPNARCAISSSQSTFLSASDVSSWLATDVGRTGYEGSSHRGLLLEHGWALMGYILTIHIINETPLFSRKSGVVAVPIGYSGQVKANLYSLAPGRSASERVEYYEAPVIGVIGLCLTVPSTKKHPPNFGQLNLNRPRPLMQFHT